MYNKSLRGVLSAWNICKLGANLVSELTYIHVAAPGYLNAETLDRRGITGLYVISLITKSEQQIQKRLFLDASLFYCTATKLLGRDSKKNSCQNDDKPHYHIYQHASLQRRYIASIFHMAKYEHYLHACSHSAQSPPASLQVPIPVYILNIKESLMQLWIYLLTYLLHGAESFLRS